MFLSVTRYLSNVYRSNEHLKRNDIIFKPTSSLSGPCSLYSIRFRHSKRQIKRLFKKNPAFHRVARRNDTLFKPLSPEKPLFKPQFPVKSLPNGWYFLTQSKEAEVYKQSLPFYVH